MRCLLQRSTPCKIFWQIADGDELGRFILRAAVAHEAAFAVNADDGQPGWAGMSAALGASRNMERCLLIEDGGNRRRQDPRRDFGRLTSRRAGAGQHAAARIGGGTAE